MGRKKSRATVKSKGSMNSVSKNIKRMTRQENKADTINLFTSLDLHLIVLNLYSFLMTFVFYLDIHHMTHQ